MHTEFRILEVRRGHVLAQPLDAVKQESLRIAGASKYIENEVIVAEPLSGATDVPSRWEVIVSRVDPSFIGGEAPKLAPIDEKNEYEFTEYVSYEEGEDLDSSGESAVSAGRSWLGVGSGAGTPSFGSSRCVRADSCVEPR